MRWILEQIRKRTWTRSLLSAAPVLALVSLFTVTGLRGVDFGEHWDEMEWHVQPTRDMVASGILLPHQYIYPALTKWLELAPAIPAGFKGGSDPKKIQEAMKSATLAPEFHLQIRRVFIVVSALAIVWIYGAALALGRKRWEALLAAASVGLSWEYAYHARWVATDCILTQFSALTLFALALFHRTNKSGWLYLAAVSAGLGTGTKYPGVVLLVPVMVASALALPGRGVPRQVFRLALLCGTAFVAYLVTTPGTLLEPFTFINELKRISSAYSGTHYGYTATGGWHHGKIALTYLAFSYFSPYKIMAVPMFASAFLGALVWARSDRRVAAVLICFPIVFLIYFCGSYTIAIARNYIVITPFLAILAARGITEVFERIADPRVRRALVGVLTLVMASEAVWLVRAGESIRHVDPVADVREALAHVSKHAGTRFRLSDRITKLASEQHMVLPPNVTGGSDAQVVMFFAKGEGPNPRQWKTNDPWLTEAVFGPGEVNFNWYATWQGNDRVVAMTVEKARSTGVALAH